MKIKLKLKKLHIITLCFSVLFIVNSCFISCTDKNEQDSNEYSVISDYIELKQIIENKTANTLIIDLRKNRDYELSHITDSINVPYKDNDDGEIFYEYLDKNDIHNKAIYLICYNGYKSAEAFNYLTANKYKNIHCISFGFDEFAAEENDIYLEGTLMCDSCGE